jgi:hypothetical protein
MELRDSDTTPPLMEEGRGRLGRRVGEGRHVGEGRRVGEMRVDEGRMSVRPSSPVAGDDDARVSVRGGCRCGQARRWRETTMRACRGGVSRQGGAARRRREAHRRGAFRRGRAQRGEAAATTTEEERRGGDLGENG